MPTWKQGAVVYEAKCMIYVYETVTAKTRTNESEDRTLVIQ
jgi:hypothetical protein